MKTSAAQDQRIANMLFSSVYPLYLEKVKKKGRTESELQQVITWLTGYVRKKQQPSSMKK